MRTLKLNGRLRCRMLAGIRKGDCVPRVAPLRVVAASFVIALQPCTASAQELEPRAYSPSPIGTNFAAAALTYSEGDVALDPTLPLTNVSAEVGALTLAYSRVGSLLGRMASVGVALPWVHADVSGDIGEDTRAVTRDGQGDARLRLALNLLGGSALTKEEFRRAVPPTTMGTSLTIVAPTGDYNSEHLVNIGSNRWAFKPEAGISHLFDHWFAEASAGVWLFSDNENFFGGTSRSQDPINVYQLHGGYTFRPGLWLALDGTYYTGGETEIDGERKNDLQRNSRYGATLAVPLSPEFSLKAAFSKGLQTRIGGEFTTFTLALQYRWFSS